MWQQMTQYGMTGSHWPELEMTGQGKDIYTDKWKPERVQVMELQHFFYTDQSMYVIVE